MEHFQLERIQQFLQQEHSKAALTAMTYKQACRIMGITTVCDKKELKKIYHRLMHEVHPDANTEQKLRHVHVPKESSHFVGSSFCYAYTAQELNEAYEVILSEIENHNTYGAVNEYTQYEGDTSKNQFRAGKTAKTKNTGENNAKWNAPINPNAYVVREILQNVEDYDGTIVGNFVIAEGKYYWTSEEEFALFLQSTYACGKRLLAKVDERLGRDSRVSSNMALQAKLTYLLTQQFIDMDDTLVRLAREEESLSDDTYHTFYLSAMLELEPEVTALAAGQTLYPYALKERKLYLADAKQKKLGYLSFLDDRMYYVVIPLFEQRRAQVKLQTAKPCAEKAKRRRGAATYVDVDMWLRIPRITDTTLPENLNQQIEEVLREYGEVN